MNSKLAKIKDIIPQILAVAFVLVGIFYWRFNTDKSIFKIKETSSPTPVEEQVVNEQNYKNPEDKYIFFRDKAEERLNQKEERKADFWLARYFRLAIDNDQIGFIFSGLDSLLSSYKTAKPTSFISGKYDSDFLGWFIYNTYRMWDFNEEEQGLEMDENITFQLAGTKDGKYAAVVFGSYPMLEAWSFIGLPDDESVVLASVLGNPEGKIYLSVAELEEKINEQTDTYNDKKYYDKVEIDLGGHPLQYLWDSEFYDLDKDGIPEVWIRYNKANADGFEQELAIYKIAGDKMTLFKKLTGNAEGIARRIDNNQIEVGEGIPGSDSEGHLNFSKFRLETWGYKNGDFSKISEKIIPHILLSSDWKNYYDLELH